jgi:transcriptional regulator with XRE-family HTH domain
MSREQGTVRRTAAQLALIDLRAELDMSQQDLSAALGTTVRTVARWETAAFPNGRIVKRLEQLASKRGLIYHAAQFRRLYQQEQFLKANRKFFLTIEGLDLQVAIVQIRQLCKDRQVASCWSDALQGLSAAVSRLLDFCKDGQGVWEGEEVFDLWERLHEYAKQPEREAIGLQKPVTKHKEGQKQVVKRRPSK